MRAVGSARCNSYAMINCVLFSEFHVKAGPSLVCQFPLDYLSEPQFKSVCDILIPRPELCGKVISVQLPSSDYIIGMPVVIVNDKYERQKIEFNFALCVSSEEYEYLHVYEGVVRKMAIYLTLLEQETSFVSTPEKQTAIHSIVQQIFIQLTTRKECFIDVDPYNFILLKLKRKPLMSVRPVPSWMVPVPISPLGEMMDSSIDLALRHFLPMINGVYYIKEIARISQIDERLVKNCIQQLIHCGVVALVDVFQFSNVYITRPRVRQVMLDLGPECLSNIEACENVTTAEVFSWYCEMNYRSVEELLELHQDILNKVNVKKFIIFGVIRGFIQKQSRYYVATSDLPENIERRELLVQLLDGTHSLDEICCTLDLCAREVEQIVQPFCHTFVK